MKRDARFLLREAQPSYLAYLREMLYEAVFWRASANKPSFEEGLAYPEVSKVLADWGARDRDVAVVATVDGKVGSTLGPGESRLGQIAERRADNQDYLFLQPGRVIRNAFPLGLAQEIERLQVPADDRTTVAVRTVQRHPIAAETVFPLQ